MERSGWAPSPPIREGATAGSPEAATAPETIVAAVAPTPGQAPAADPDDVTRTLASLADLRDRGAISAEEYERKKAELLSRI
jgi:hypothetical protein